MTNETDELVNENEVESNEIDETPVETNDDDEHDEHDDAPNEELDAEEDSSDDEKSEESLDSDPEWWKNEESRNRVAATIRRKATKKAEEKAFKEAYEQAMSDFQEASSQFPMTNPVQDNQAQQPVLEAQGFDPQQAAINQSSLIKQRHIAALGNRRS